MQSVLYHNSRIRYRYRYLRSLSKNLLIARNFYFTVSLLLFLFVLPDKKCQLVRRGRGGGGGPLQTVVHAGKYSSRFQQKTAVTSNLAPTPRWKGIKLFLCIIIENTDTAGSDIFLARMRPPFLKYRFLQVDIKY